MVIQQTECNREAQWNAGPMPGKKDLVLKSCVIRAQTVNTGWLVQTFLS
jgi:hypothetical protein